MKARKPTSVKTTLVGASFRPVAFGQTLCSVVGAGLPLFPVRHKRAIRVLVRLAAIVAVGIVLGARANPASAQADYRNLDPGRPIAVEDAQPIEHRAFEAQFGIPRFSRERRGHWSFGFEPELKWGIAKDLQFGYSSEYVVAHDSGRTVLAARDRQIHLLYNFNQESRRWPAISIRPELAIRSGGLGSGREHGTLKAIVSKTAGLNRLHWNGSWTAGPTAAAGRGGESVNRYFYGAAYERMLPLKFFVLLADVYARKPIDHARTEVVFDLGTRMQLTPRWVLDAAISSGILRRSAGPDIGFTFGVSHTFSLRWLYPRSGK